MKFKSVSVMLALSTLASGSFAQTHQHSAPQNTNTFTIEWVIAEVRQHNPSLAAARANVQAADERVTQARAWDSPRAAFDTKAGRFVSVPDNSFTDQRLDIEQPLPITGKNRLRGHAAKAEAAITAEELRRRELDLIAQARASFLRLANAYELLDLNRDNAGFLKQIADNARLKYEAGTETQANVLNAETELAKLEESAFDFQRHISDEESVLNTLMNHSPQAPLGKPLVPAMNVLPGEFEQLSAMAFAHRPEVISAQRKIAEVKANLRLAQRQWIPDPSLRAEVSRYNGASQAVSELMVGVAIELPWLNHRKLSAGVREQRALLESAEQQLLAAKAEAAGMVRQQLNKLHTFHHHYELFAAKVLPLSRQTIEASRLSYEAGKTGFMDLMVMRHNAQDSEVMLIQHQTDYQIAVAELEAIIGAPLLKEQQ
jgi:cobalt-zinc-cadmium efflux system outer membrane protein